MGINVIPTGIVRLRQRPRQQDLVVMTIQTVFGRRVRASDCRRTSIHIRMYASTWKTIGLGGFYSSDGRIRLHCVSFRSRQTQIPQSKLETAPFNVPAWYRHCSLSFLTFPFTFFDGNGNHYTYYRFCRRQLCRLPQLCCLRQQKAVRALFVSVTTTKNTDNFTHTKDKQYGCRYRNQRLAIVAILNRVDLN